LGINFGFAILDDYIAQGINLFGSGGLRDGVFDYFSGWFLQLQVSEFCLAWNWMNRPD